MRTFNEMLDKQLENDEFKKEYEAIQPELDEIRVTIDASESQNLTKKTLSDNG